MRHHVLIITYLFPPSGGVGPPRYVAYTRYLPEHGCDVSVLTARHPHTPVYDPDLIARVPPETRIYRVFNPDVPYALRDQLWKRIAVGSPPTGTSKPRASFSTRPQSWLKAAIQRIFNPDVQKFWVPFVIRAARQIIRESRIDSVILNTPPYSLYSIVPPLTQEFPGVNWITEIRDDWLGYYLTQFDTARTPDKEQLARKLERDAIEASDFVVTVAPSQQAGFRRRYPDQAPQKFLCVTNGYDGDRYRSFRPRRHARANMVITYFGSLYRSGPYDIRPYLDALESLAGPIRDQVETRFIGRIALDVEPLLDRQGLNIRKLGFMPASMGVAALEESDYLLLVEHQPTAISAKLFDYLPTGLPVLALCENDSDVAQIIASTGAGVSVNGRDPAAIRAVLLDAFGRLAGQPHNFPEPDRDAIGSYDRRKLVADFVRLTGIGQMQSSAKVS